MQGKIIKGIAGFYYVDVAESGIYECKAKGIFRKEKKKPLVGDNVEIEVLDEKEKTGNLIQILPRKNELIRPAAANVDQALVIFAVRQPDPNYQLLDRFLITMEQQEIPSIICFNKKDLAEQEELDQMYQIYISCGYQVLLTSAEQEEGISQIRKILEGKTTVVAGPSGVGKSSLTNLLQEEVSMETGEISKKLKRGRHTTRHAQLLTARFTVMLKSPSLAVSSVAASSLVSSSAASSAVSSVLAALSSFAVVLLFPQPANIDTVNVAANRMDKTFFFILSSLLFLLLINRSIHYQISCIIRLFFIYSSSRWHATQ